MAQSKNFGVINFIFVFALLIGLVARVSAHGIMLSPPTRLMYNSNFTEVLTQVANPTMKLPCGTAGDEPGPITVYKPSDQIILSYKVTIPHGGDCLAQISWKGDHDFETIKNIGTCGQNVSTVVERIELPDKECNKCTFRFMWVDNLGNNYLNCANIQIKKSHDSWYYRKRSGATRRMN